MSIENEKPRGCVGEDLVRRMHPKSPESFPLYHHGMLRGSHLVKDCIGVPPHLWGWKHRMQSHQLLVGVDPLSAKGISHSLQKARVFQEVGAQVGFLVV